jgi:hypothetical protein
MTAFLDEYIECQDRFTDNPLAMHRMERLMERFSEIPDWRRKLSSIAVFFSAGMRHEHEENRQAIECRDVST